MAKCSENLWFNKKPAEGGLEILMVAEAGFELTTFGL